MSDEFNDPKKGEGWDEFLEEGDDDVWIEAFETDENDHLDIEHYDEFANIQELVNFVYSTGEYQDTRPFSPDSEDIDDKKREIKNDVWKVPEKLEEIEEYLKDGAMRGEIDIDPNAYAKWNVSKKEANKRDCDTKYTAHFVACNPDDKGGDAHFYIASSWYDTPPEEMNVEEIFDIEEIYENMEK